MFESENNYRECIVKLNLVPVSYWSKIEESSLCIFVQIHIILEGLSVPNALPVMISLVHHLVTY